MKLPEFKECDLKERINNYVKAVDKIREALYNIKNTEKGEILLNKICKLNLDSTSLKIYLGMALVEFEEYELGFEQLQYALPSGPDQIEKKIIEDSTDFLKRNNFTNAIKICTYLNDLVPKNPIILNTIGELKRKQGKISAAENYFKKALERNNQYLPAILNLGKLYRKSEKYQDSIRQFKKAIAFDKYNLNSYYGLGNTLLEMGKCKSAIKALKIALDLAPDNEDILFKLGRAYSKMEKYQEATKYYKQVIEKAPDYGQAYNYISIALFNSGKLQEAEQLLKYGYKESKQNPQIASNLGNILRNMGKFDEALKYIDKALKKDPQNSIALFNRSLIYLVEGNFIKGFEEYKHRWNVKNFKKNRFDLPLWKGNKLREKKLIVSYEQGFGDTIQFIRFIDMIRERVQNFSVQCQDELYDLFQASYPDINLIKESDTINISKYDYQLPILTIPRILQITEELIPAETPYLTPSNSSLTKINNRLQIDKNKINIGIVWRGRESHQNDINRSCSIDIFNPIFQINNIQFYSLQKRQSNKKFEYKGYPMIDLNHLITNFSDTAAIIEQLDLIISVDTSVAHLAGALDKPTWIILPYNVDWRWMLERDDSPWYPNVRLFRQNSLGDWYDVINQIYKELMNLLKNK